MSAVAAWLAGEISPEVALSRLLLEGLAPEEILRNVPPGSALAALARRQQANLHAVSRMLAQARIDHASGQDPQAIAAMFDRAVAEAPDASVAAYTLNDPDVAARATAEIVDWIVAQGLAAGPVLDLGCGTGRIAAALAPHVGHVLGLDVSAGMVAQARQRHGGDPRLRFDVTDGQAPRHLPAGGFGLVLAVDSFPYLIQSGLARAHVQAAAACLRPGGALVILNLSYGADASGTLQGWCEALGLSLEQCGTRPFALWDGAAFVLRRTETKPCQGGPVSR